MFALFFSLYTTLPPGEKKKKSPKLSNCEQIKSPYLFILSVSTVLGLVLPGILNRLPLLSGGRSAPALHLPWPRGSAGAPRGVPAGRARAGLAERCAVPRAGTAGPGGAAAVPGRRQVPACAAPRRRR